MWLSIIATILAIEVLGGFFFYSIARAGHRADQRMYALRRSRVIKRRATRLLRRNLAGTVPPANAPQTQHPNMIPSHR